MELAVKCLVGVANTMSNQAFAAVLSCEDNVEALKNRMKVLSSKRTMIDRRTKDAKKKGMEVNTEVDDWLEDVACLEREATDLDSAYKSTFKCFNAVSPAIWQQYRLSTTAKNLWGRAESLIEAGSFSEVASEPSSTCFTETPGGMGAGMDRTLRQLQLYMEDDKAEVIALCGMGRIGKTNVLEKFMNEFIPKGIEEMWYIDLELEGLSDVRKIQKLVMQKLGLTCPENKSFKELSVYIYKHLKGRQYLLIFDNVRTAIDLRGIGVPVGKGKGGKVILTTRSLDVCQRMEAKVVKVKGLKWDFAWSLFLKKAGETAQRLIMKKPRIEEVAKSLVWKCDGLPEAITAVGYAVASKENIDQWEHVLEILTIRPWKLQGICDLLSQLKSSFDELDPKLLTCLLYCSLYPEGLSIAKQWVIDYCIGEGLIDGYNEGESQLGELKAASLLETGDDEDSITMHPMVRATALWVACECGEMENKFLVQAGMGLKEAPLADSWHGAQRISLMRNDIRSLLEVPDCPNLETLLLQRNRRLERVHEDFFWSMPKLRVLDISHTDIEHLPTGICRLASLQYLDLCGTKVRSLPSELGDLVNLRFLLLSYMENLQVVPSGVFAKLHELQVLYLHNSYGKWSYNELNELRRLKALGITIENLESLEMVAKSYRLARCTRNIYINGCDGLWNLSMTYFGDDFRDVHSIQVVNCEDLKELKIDRNEWYLAKLESLFLEKVPNVKIVWLKGCFDNLRFLRIKSCEMVECLVYFDDDETRSLQSTTIEVFPNLKQLDLVDLLQMKSLCSDERISVAFPSLQVLYVEGCPNLKTLKMSLEQGLFVCGANSWWQGLDRDAFDMKYVFHFPLEMMKA